MRNFETQEPTELHVGVLSLDKKHLISPTEEPSLFVGQRNTAYGSTLEKDVTRTLAKHDIIASSDRALRPYELSDDIWVDGYLTRESATIDVKEHEFHVFSDEEICEYVREKAHSTVEGFFLRQIYLHMNSSVNSRDRAARVGW